MRDRSPAPPPPPLLNVAAQVPLPPSPKPFSRFFSSSINHSRTPQDIPLPPSPMRPSSALSSTSSNDRCSSFDTRSAEPGSRWSPYSTPSAPKSSPFAAIRRSFNLSGASSALGSETNDTRRSSSILSSSGGGITAMEIVCPSPQLRLQVDAEPYDSLPRPPSPLPPSSFNFLKRANPPSSPSPFTSVLDVSPTSGSPPPIRRSRKSFWPSRVSGGSRNAEQGGAPNKLGEKLNQFVEDAKRKLGGGRGTRRKTLDASRPARDLDARDDRLLKAALRALFGESNSASPEAGDDSRGRGGRVAATDHDDVDASSSPTSPRRLRRRMLSPSSPSRGPHTTPATPPRRGRTRTPKLPRVSFGAPFEVDSTCLSIDEAEENDTSGEETPKASRMIRKVMSVEELGRERDGDETPTRHRAPRHSVSTPALRTYSASTSKPRIKTLRVLEDAPVLASTARDNSDPTRSTTFRSTSPVDQQHLGDGKEDKPGYALQPRTSFSDLTNTLPPSDEPPLTPHIQPQSISYPSTRSQVHGPSPLSQSHFPAEEDDLIPPLRMTQQRPALGSMRYSFASDEGEEVEEQKGEWVDESVEGSEDEEGQRRRSVESSATFGNKKQVTFSDSCASSYTEQELRADTAGSSSTELPSLPLTRPPSCPPPLPPRSVRYSSEWLSYAEAAEDDEAAGDSAEDDSFDHSSSPSTPTAFSRALQTPLPRSSSTNSLNSLDDSPTSPPLPPIDDDRRRSHPIPYTSLRSLPSFNSLDSISSTSTSTQRTPRLKPSHPLPPTSTSISEQPQTPPHPSAPSSTPTAVVRYKDATTHPLLRGTFLLSTKLAASAGGKGEEQ